MKKTLFLLFCTALINFNANARTCDVSPTHLLAKYQVKQLAEHGRMLSTKLNLYRYGDQIGHFYPEKHYGDWWTKTATDQVMLTRYFPKYHRAIEYQAEDIKGKEVRKKAFWQKKKQLISTKLLSKMQVERVTGTGCHRIEILTYREHGKKYQVRWLPQLQLVERFDVTKGSKVLTSWRLKNLEGDKAFINTYVTNIQKYQSTDYADIGDHENDPFLAKMIHQGFNNQATVEHGHAH